MTAKLDDEQVSGPSWVLPREHRAAATSTIGVSFQPFQVNEKEHLAGKLRGRKDSLVSYIYTAIAVEDWHAVADAACDLREIDAKLEVMK